MAETLPEDVPEAQPAPGQRELAQILASIRQRAPLDDRLVLDWVVRWPTAATRGVRCAINAYKRAPPPGQGVAWIVTLAEAPEASAEGVAAGVLKTLPGTVQRVIAGDTAGREAARPVLEASQHVLAGLAERGARPRAADVRHTVKLLRDVGATDAQAQSLLDLSAALKALVELGEPFLPFRSILAATEGTGRVERGIAAFARKLDWEGVWRASHDGITQGVPVSARSLRWLASNASSPDEARRVYEWARGEGLASEVLVSLTKQARRLELPWLQSALAEAERAEEKAGPRESVALLDLHRASAAGSGSSRRQARVRLELAIAELARGGRWQQAWCLHEQDVRDGGAPDARRHTVLIRNAPTSEDAWRAFEDLDAHGPVSAFAATAFLAAVSIEDVARAVERLEKSSATITPKVLTVVSRRLWQAGRAEDAARIDARMAACSPVQELPSSTVTPLVIRLVRAGNWPDAWRLHRACPPVQAEQRRYTVLVHGAPSVDAAWEVIVDLTSRGHAPGHPVLSAFLAAFGRHARTKWSEAWRELAGPSEHDLAKVAEAWTALATGAAPLPGETMSWSEVWARHLSRVSAGTRPSVSMVRRLVRNAPTSDDVWRVLDHAEQKGLIQDDRLLAWAIRPPKLDGSESGRAWALVARLMSAGYVPDPRVVGALLALCSAGEEGELAWEIFERCLHAGVAPNAHLVSLIARAGGSVASVDRLRALVALRTTHGVAFDRFAWTSLLGCMARRGEAAWVTEMAAQMIADGVTPDTVSCNRVLETYIRAHDDQRALAAAVVFDAPHGLPPDERTLRLLASPVLGLDGFRAARAALRGMLGRGEPPGPSAVDALLASACRHASPAELEELLHETESFTDTRSDRLTLALLERGIATRDSFGALPILLERLHDRIQSLDTVALCRLARAERSLGNLRDAEAIYGLALARSRDDTERGHAALGQGVLLVRLGESSKALPPLRVAAALPDFRRIAGWWLSTALIELGRSDDALARAAADPDEPQDASNHVLAARALWARALAGAERPAHSTTWADADQAISHLAAALGQSPGRAGIHAHRDASLLAAEIAAVRGASSISDLFRRARPSTVPTLLRALSTRGVFHKSVLRDVLSRSLRMTPRLAVAIGQYVGAWRARSYLRDEDLEGVLAACHALGEPTLLSSMLITIGRELNREVATELLRVTENMLSGAEKKWEAVARTPIVALVRPHYQGRAPGVPLVRELRMCLEAARAYPCIGPAIVVEPHLDPASDAFLVTSMSRHFTLACVNELLMTLERAGVGLTGIRIAVKRTREGWTEAGWVRLGVTLECREGAEVLEALARSSRWWAAVGAIGPRAPTIEAVRGRYYVKLFLWPGRTLPRRWAEVSRLVFSHVGGKSLDGRRTTLAAVLADVVDDTALLEHVVGAVEDTAYARVIDEHDARLLAAMHTAKDESSDAAVGRMGRAFADVAPRDPRWFDLNAAALRLIEGFEAGHPEIAWELSPTGPSSRMSFGVEPRLAHALIDVLHNSLDAVRSKADGIRRVSVQVARIGGESVVRVVNTAPAARAPGSGLGKQNVARVVAEHSGTFRAEPLADGTGYLWELRWPLPHGRKRT